MSDTTLLHRDLTDGIIGVYHHAHYELGDGFLEKVCQRALVIALTEAGFEVAEEVPFRVYFRGNVIGEFFHVFRGHGSRSCALISSDVRDAGFPTRDSGLRIQDSGLAIQDQR